MITVVRIKKAVKVSTGNYENTDISMELESTIPIEDAEKKIDAAVKEMTDYINTYLKNAVDEIELGKRKSESKARRFGL
jgi:hypothetical protein